MATTQDAYQAAYDATARLLFLLTQVIANPTQANVDAVVSGAQAAGNLVLKPTYSADGESYDWAGYRRALIESQKALKELIALESWSQAVEVRSWGV